MTYIVTAGYVTVETAVPGGRARIDIPRGRQLPADVPGEQREILLRLGQIAEAAADEPETAAADDDQRLAELKAEAEQLGVKLHHSMKAETIEKKIAEARAAAQPPAE